MEIGDFTYHRPTALREACELGHSLGVDARFLAGGTDLLVDLKTRRIRTAHLIALDGIDELRRIRLDGPVLRVGALATMSDLAASEAVRSAAPALAEAALSMGAHQIRNRATVGGNFCAAVPCADTPPICIVHEARLRLVGPRGERTVAAESFFTGPRQTVLAPGEVLAEIDVPVSGEHTGASYQRFARRRYASLAVASVAARVVLDGKRVKVAHVALGAVAPVPLLVPSAGELLAGQAPTDALVDRAAHAAADAARPITDLRSSEPFRRDLVETLTRRALRTALERARGA